MVPYTRKKLWFILTIWPLAIAAACSTAAPVQSASSTSPNGTTVTQTESPTHVDAPQGSAQISGSLGGLSIKPVQAVYEPVRNDYGRGNTAIIVGEQLDLCDAIHNYSVSGNLLRIGIVNDAGDLEVGDYDTIGADTLKNPNQTHVSFVELSGFSSTPSGPDDGGDVFRASSGVTKITAMPDQNQTILRLTLSAADPAGGPGLNGQVTAVLCPDPPR